MNPFSLIQPENQPDEVLPLTAAEFSRLPVMREMESAVKEGAAIAVALSGGADSLALCVLLHEWVLARHLTLHALTVDHSLRPESAEEARRVGALATAHCPGLRHVVLRRDPEKIAPTRLQEEARRDRYRLMRGYCVSHGIRYLCLAHHQDDQVETFLFRLAKGSGIDGLAGMRAVVPAGDADLDYVRPLLDIPKGRLVAACRARGLDFINDPSNSDERFARARMRAWLQGLSSEGFSIKRLTQTAQRMERAARALEDIAAQVWKKALLTQSPAELVLSLGEVALQPEDIRVRILMRALERVGGGAGYGPRLEQVEDLQRHIFDKTGFTRTTLHHCLIEKSGARQTLRFVRENA
ncbi:MAG: tRNA lysidine(34) synthetase TilS [Micavibrio aeruginosavorus]|uniref:tRNA(Ile)-lysidine synthase n=1 Tax=Micavibrio aeruginosavorus TaxID=349221 RepID=A0A7T5R3S2_9BACT|nr:MAG: tRNA lysidine(34) synthetase TilS [Micavibrio aeruginosavorus]